MGLNAMGRFALLAKALRADHVQMLSSERVKMLDKNEVERVA